MLDASINLIIYKKKMQDVRRELKKNRQRHVAYEENGDFQNI
jgi:hypothetical protein